MINEFVAIDFETANSNRSSACSIGYAVVIDGKITETGQQLIKPDPPYFDQYLSDFIHHITAKDVKNAPEFLGMWQQLKPILSGRPWVAHNASFDISVMRHAFDLTGTPYPEATYYCTRIISKFLWPGLYNYKLTTVADHLGIQFQHHNAKQDAIACAKVVIHACKEKEVNTLTELSTMLNSQPEGHLFSDGHTPANGRMPRKNIAKLTPESDNFNTAHPFYARRVVFTGTLRSMTRAEAAQYVVNAGGNSTSAISGLANFLVVGDQDYTQFVDGKKSSKMKKAEKLIAKGKDIEIIPESDFLQLLVQ